MNDNPKCYSCKYRAQALIGGHHSECKHPDAFMLLAAQIMYGFNKKVVGNSHGIRSGWFNWPLNFDPIWLERCDLFEEKEPICKCGHHKDNHEGDNGEGDCHHNEHCSGVTECLCSGFKEKK